MQGETIILIVHPVEYHTIQLFSRLLKTIPAYLKTKSPQQLQLNYPAKPRASEQVHFVRFPAPKKKRGPDLKFRLSSGPSVSVA